MQRIAPELYGFPGDGKEVFNLIGIDSTREHFFNWLDLALADVKPLHVKLGEATYFVSIEGTETCQGFRLIGILSRASQDPTQPQEAVLACIQIRETAPGQIQAICETLPIPKLLEALERLEDEIKRVYGLDYEDSEGERQVTENSVEEESTTSETLADDILPDKLKRGGRYGTCRDLTTDEVREIVARCKVFQAKGGKVTTFFDQLNIYPGEPRSFTLETLRGWLKDPRFTEE